MDKPTVMAVAHCRWWPWALWTDVRWWIRLLPFLGLAAMRAVGGEAFTNSDCLECHLDPATTWTVNGKTVAIIFPTNAFQSSVHARLDCVDCHTTITNLVHDPLPPPDCLHCHSKEAGEYASSIHGLKHLPGKVVVVQCWDCHGSHDILPLTSPKSPLDLANQLETCGRCHAQEARDVAASVHGQALASGERDAPTCADCHSEHQIERLRSGPALGISEVCSRCHASVYLDEKYNLPADRVKTYLESYHGLAAQNGSTIVANCASCHGYHKVLPSANPDSMTNPGHLVATCGKCHPGANQMFVSGKIHDDISAGGDGHDAGGRINRWVRRIYLTLIFSVVGAMFIHNALIFYKKVAVHLRAIGRPVLRMSLSHRWQHAVLALSFIILTVTGLALRFPDSGLAAMLGSSEAARRWTHRMAGIVMLLTGLYHLIHVLTTREGRRLVNDLLPVKKDLTDLMCAVRYLLGLSAAKPQIGRFGYTEKMEYWAVIWGTIIMGVTGLMIWFKLDVTMFLPRWVVDVALTIHYYEAVLACLAILVWHFYHVIFDPDIYPLNTACWDGRMSEEWQKHEHPLENQMLPAPPTISNSGKTQTQPNPPSNNPGGNQPGTKPGN